MSHRRLKVLFVHHRNELGGAPTSLSYLARELDSDEYEVHAYLPPGPAAQLLAAAGATVHTGPVATFTHIWASTYSGRRWLLFGRELVRLPSHLIALQRLFRREQFDIVHLNDSPLLPAGWLASRKGACVVWHVRASLGQGTERGALRTRLIRKLILRTSDRVVAINEDIAEQFDAGEQVEVVFNSVDLDRFQPGAVRQAKQEIEIDPDIPAVGFISFLYPEKGYREFLRAAAVNQRAGVRAQYLVVGSGVRSPEFFRTRRGRLLRALGLTGDYEGEAHQLAASLGLSELVHFIPFTGSPETFYRACDVVVAPSQGPELGRSTIEAAASGRPVVTTGSATGGGVVLPNETGLLVPRGSVDELAAAVRMLIDDSEMRDRFGARGRAHAEATFAPEANGARIARIYSTLIERRRRTRVLYVHHRPQLGGAPLSLAMLIRNLDPRFDSHVYCPAGPAVDLFRSAGATVHTGPISMFVHVWEPYQGARWALLLREAALLPAHLLRLHSVLRRGKFDIVHLNESTLLPAAWLARRFDVKVVWHLRTALLNDGLDRRSRFVVGVIDRTADAAIAIDQDVADRFRLRHAIDIVPNSTEIRPTDSVPSAAAKRALSLPEEVPAVGFFGYIRRQKGWPELVEAAQHLIAGGGQAQFVVMGGGVRGPRYFRTWRGWLLARLGLLVDEETDLHELVDQMDLANYFHFVPFATQTRAVYEALDIIVFPNQEVGLGRPVLEAAASARPVVASGSTSGAEVLVPGVTGLLVEAGDPVALAEAIGGLIGDPVRRREMGEAAFALARERFDPVRNARAVSLIYERLVETYVAAPAVEEEVLAR